MPGGRPPCCSRFQRRQSKGTVLSCIPSCHHLSLYCIQRLLPLSAAQNAQSCIGYIQPAVQRALHRQAHQSAGMQVNANLALVGFDAERDFDAIVSADLFERLKPAPDIFLAAAEQVHPMSL